MADAPPVKPKYWAFLSYSHQDNLTARANGSRGCVRWAEWLHRELETFRVPTEFRARQTATGEAMPERFFPVFQDEKELPINANLGSSISTALEQSRFLIVICSPRSAISHYVNEEVRHWKALGREDRILTLIVAGEPNVGDGSKRGFSPAEECFCPALRHPLDVRGAVDLTCLPTQEPIAGDVRVKTAGLAREVGEQDWRAARPVLDFMRLKLLAGLMGVGFDELAQRDKARALEEARARARRLRALVTAFAVIGAAAVAGAVFAWQQRGVADTRRKEAEAASIRADHAAEQALAQESVAKDQTKRAQAARNDAENLINFMQYDLRNTLSTVGRLELMEDINRHVSKYFDRNAAEPGNLRAQRERGVLLAQQGEVRSAQGDAQGALAAYRQALDMAEALVARDPNNAIWQDDVNSYHSRVGDLHLAQGYIPGAVMSYQQSLRARQALADHDPGDFRLQRELSVAHIKIGDALLAQGHTPMALAAYRRAHAIREALVTKDSRNVGWKHDLLASYCQIGDVLRIQGDSAGALVAFRQALALAETLVARDPDHVDWQNDLRATSSSVGHVLQEQDDIPGALAVFRQALSMAETLAAKDPDNAQWQRSLGVAHSEIGDALLKQGDAPGAGAAYQQALAIMEALAAQNPGNAAWQSDLGASHVRVGEVLSAQGNKPAALAAFWKALAIAESLAAKDPANAGWQRELALSHERLGNVLLEQTKPAEALAAFERALAIVTALARVDPENSIWQNDVKACQKAVERAQGEVRAPNR